LLDARVIGAVPALSQPFVVEGNCSGRPPAGPGRVVYVVGGVAGQAVLMEAWLAAGHLTAAGGCSRPARSAVGSGSARMAGVGPFGVVGWVGSVRMPSEAS